jgi:hemerythrin superfamily protein
VATAAKEDLVDLLLEQHGQIKELFVKLLAAPAGSRREPLEDLVRLLAVHETAEEQLVHPLARKRIESGDAVVEARLHEEHQAKQALSDLYDAGVDHLDFQTKVMMLRDAVVAHSTREEQEEFPRLRQSVPAEQLERLASAVRTAESVAPTRPHPGAESATANMLLGPPLAIFDRVRDMMRDARQQNDES